MAGAVRAVGFGWTHAGRTRPALQDITLTIEPGERVLLCGDSGSGKSTLLKAIAGVLGGPEDGSGIGKLEVGNAHVGFVLQDPDSQVISSRVGDDVAFGCENLGVPATAIWTRVQEALELVGLDVALDHPTQRLSGGQKQRLALAGVIAMRPDVIVLDEPTANIDPAGVNELVAAVTRVVERTGCTLIVAEHNFAPWAGLLDRALHMDHGTIIDDTSFAVAVTTRQLPPLPTAVPASMEELAASCTDLVCRFGPSRTVEIPRAASTVVRGANGTGKTTWLHTMAGLLEPLSGHIQIGDFPGQPAQWTSREVAARLGFVFQDPDHQFVARTVEEELWVAPRVLADASRRTRSFPWSRRAARGGEDPAMAARIGELLERLRLSHLAQANPFSLSGGEKRRLSVATALVASPGLVFLDEPTFGQDPQTFTELVALLQELVGEGLSIVSVSHDEHFAAAMGNHRVDFTLTGEEVQ